MAQGGDGLLREGDLLPPPSSSVMPPEAVVSQWRYSHESDWQWGLRRTFICRHLHKYPGAALDQLLALSSAWTNHIFLGCRYSPQLMEKIFKMAEGIDIGEMPSHELVLPNAPKAQKRPPSPCAGCTDRFVTPVDSGLLENWDFGLFQYLL
ncbi:NF-kappa-B-repressing factor isoform X3 [Vombatus ursinus]|uniref:NF-kappa-B-repressing factor isoform X3 n=1 Tax=Vombatus ursinus TaxID=29139 RepID=UPI000FFDA621|nr:NF-kappa-B-repressing factor isoform X3 [Vombatus ursinus]